jgi:error-prone DNA polymerase
LFTLTLSTVLTLPALPVYCELHCLSNFTFLRGASHAEELVVRAKALGYSALAITDECSFAGIVRAHVAAKAHGIKLIVGTEVVIEDGPKLVLLATNRESYGHISALITRARRRAVKGSYCVTLADLELNLDHCLALLIPPCSRLRPDDLDVDTPAQREAAPLSPPPLPQAGEGELTWHTTLQHARLLARRFPQRAWIAVELLSGPNDKAQLDALRELSTLSGLPLVAAGDVHMHLRSRKPLQDTLTAIRLNTTVAEAGHHLQPNAERHLRSRAALARIYPPELLAETQRIADRCDFSLDSLRYEYPHELTPPGKTAAAYLRELTFEGLAQRYPQGTPAQVQQQIEHELQLLSELQYEHFVLTVYDVVKFARGQNILCQGRGSAANSAVCYALGITEVDPARMSMLFERFVSRERDEPPDIDVDFEHQRREEVIQYIYNKYGRDRAALAATVITYRSKSALRDVGRALGFESGQIDRLARSMRWWDGRQVIPERMREAGLDPDATINKLLFLLINLIVGFPRHLSQHVGGFIISQGPLGRLVPIENAAMPERSVIQWDKDDLEALGLLKVDVLALGMLSAIRRTLDMISARGTPLTMQNILDRGDDPAVYNMIQHADTIGVFQIESRAQMTMLPRLKPAKFYDLVIEVAIVRPGPIQGGMVHPYLRRRQGLEPVSYPSEAVRAVLERTLGVPIFQEQVMQLAIVAAGFTPGEADQLRRAMAAWKRKGGLEHFHQRLLDGMHERGYTQAFAEQIYQQICGFGEYGFPESHSASFALLAYVSSWLKHYEPAAFLAAMLNSQPLGFYSASQLVQDAQRHGVAVLPADVTVSDWECTLEPREDATLAVRLGLNRIRGLSQASALRIVSSRNAQAIDAFAKHAALSQADLQRMAQAGALATLAGHRRNAHWLAAGAQPQPQLFEDVPILEAPPQLPAPSEGQDIVADYQSTGLTLGRHPLALLRPRLTRMKLITAAALAKLPNGWITRAAGIVTCRQRPGTASGVVFVTLEDETGYINVVVWNTVVENQRRELLSARLMAVEGEVQKEGDVVHLIARRLTDHTRLLGTLATASRDFH